MGYRDASLGLNTTANENRPTSSQGNGVEIVFYSDRPGSAATDLWVATRATTAAPWSTPVRLTATANGSANDLHPSLSLSGRTLVFGSDRTGGSGGNDLWVTTRAAELTVTADDQTRLFGQANPPLAHALSGFISGET